MTLSCKWYKVPSNYYYTIEEEEADDEGGLDLSRGLQKPNCSNIKMLPLYLPDITQRKLPLLKWLGLYHLDQG